MSGSSTPRSATTPPPTGDGAGGPSPLTVGTRFVKQYYKILSTDPDQVSIFYRPTSVLSVGVGSQQVVPITFEKQGKDLKDRFVHPGLEDCAIRFEFENGAIDAQMSVNGGVLLVATGHVVYLGASEEENDVRRKAFVHTFFLGSLSSGGKRSYYVHNDVLRFLHDDEEKTVVASNKTTTEVTVTAEKEVQLPPAVEEPPVEVTPAVVDPTPEPEPVLEEELEPVERALPEIGSPGGGVEEEKEAVIEEEDVVVTEKEVVVETTEKVVGETVVKTEVKETAVTATAAEPAAAKPVPPAKPNSWASLFAGNGALPPPSNPSTPSRPSAKAKAAASPPKTPKTPAPAPAAQAPAAAEKAESGNNNNNNNNAGRSRGGTNKRDPDNTLVIKSFGGSTTEADVRGMFEPFAGDNDSKVIGCTVSTHKALAFIDYDSSKPVLAALEKHKKEPFQLGGQTVEMYQKTHDYQKPQNRRNQGGKGNPGRGSGGGGGQSGGGGGGTGGGGGGGGGGSSRQYRRSGSGAGRGERGGGGRGRGGR